MYRKYIYILVKYILSQIDRRENWQNNFLKKTLIFENEKNLFFEFE